MAVGVDLKGQGGTHVCTFSWRLSGGSLLGTTVAHVVGTEQAPFETYVLLGKNVKSEVVDEAALEIEPARWRQQTGTSSYRWHWAASCAAAANSTTKTKSIQLREGSVAAG